MNKKTIFKKKVLLIAASISAFIYIGWRLFFTIPLNFGVMSFIFGVALALSETVGVIEAFSHYRSLSSNVSPELPIIEKELYPDIDVLIATHSESVDLLYKTINGCIHMDYPDKNKVHIYICDDTNRPEMKALANHMGIGYFGLSDNKHAKAGNLNNALSKTNSPLIVTFDSDMIPRRNFLMETVPYFHLPKLKKDKDGNWVDRTEDEFDENYKIGFIQTPQSFYNPDLFQFNLYSENNIPNEQDYFFKEINVGRNRSNSPIYAGSNTVISREALEAVGGITTGNITEDFATGIKIQSKGYTCFAISKVLANGLSPVDFKSLLKQRQRWGRGCVQTIRSFKFLFGDLPIKAKISYIISLLYWWTFFRRFIYILSPILFTVFGLVIVDCTLPEILFIWLPSYVLYNLALKYLSGNIRNQKWSNIVDTIIFPFMIIPIFLETIGLKLKKFAVTPKNKINSKNTDFKYAIPHIILIIATFIGLINCTHDMIKYKNIGSIVLLFWLVMNLYFLIMALFFMLSRVNFRDEERFYTNIDVVLNINSLTINGVTSDISENGMAIILSTPEYIPYDDEIDIIAYTPLYTAKLKGKVVHVSNFNNKWKYSIMLTNINEKNKMEYLQIVYDREHTLPTRVKSNIIKEIRNNISKRLHSQIISNRKLPRIPLNTTLATIDGIPIEIINFNYEYILTKAKKITYDNIKLNIGNDVLLDCSLCSISKNSNTVLYHIDNWKEISSSESLRNNLFKLVS
ncbi:Cellulose synthase catalytic subunit [UDP-forming] [uncultured Clostridium sp.]|uniref:glycosyltransferase family 2 protein n=1 Tax=uncultured Clostridium sp. TaxID=59620 RepID=UPI000821B275|nr:glycosyltransferase family 2 protein [uncultured Clostridium sp.]SCJ40761.1 Cellulose synthase catalytic subunit [UDP-forming] [uncultured Clostridium sp.]